MRLRFYKIRCALLSGLVYFIPPVAVGGSSGAFSIDLGMNSPIAIDKMLAGRMDEWKAGVPQNDLPVWVSFRSKSTFMLPEGVTIGGILTGEITSSNEAQSGSYSSSFRIDMGALNNTTGPDVLLRWPKHFRLNERYLFNTRLTLKGSITVTNSRTDPIVVPMQNFELWAHKNIRWDIPIFGTVPAKATCTLTLSQSAVSLGEIGFAQLSSAAPESRLEGMHKTVKAVTRCTGTQSAKLKLQTSAPLTANNCAKGSNFSMSFCAESGGKKINVNGDPINIYSSSLPTGHSTEINFYAAKGYGAPVVAAITAAMTIVASPH